MEVMRMETMADLSSTQEYSDIDLEGDCSREEDCCSPVGVRGLVAVQVAGSPGGGEAGGPGESPAAQQRSPRVSSPTANTTPPSPSSSTVSPQPQVNAVAPPPIRVTNFFISEILKPHFGEQKEDESQSTAGGDGGRDLPGNTSPTRPEADRSPSISPAKSENNTLSTDKGGSLKITDVKKREEENNGERRAFQVVKRKRHKSEEERNSDICKLSIRDEGDRSGEFIGSRIPGGRPRAEFPPHGLPPGIPPGGVVPPFGAMGPGSGGPSMHASLQAHLYPQLMNNRYYHQYHPYYQLYYQQYQQLQQLQRQQQLYSALQQHNNRRLDAGHGKSPLSLDIHHSVEGDISKLSRLNGKPETLSSPTHKLAPPNHHSLRDFPENYESFRNGVSPGRRSSTSSENESTISDNPVRNLSRTFSRNGTQDRLLTAKPVNNAVVGDSAHQQRGSPHKPAGAASQHPPQQQKGFAAVHSPDAPSVCSSSDGGKSAESEGPEKEGRLWPAWVYCTRYSDRPSSGPRSRKMKKRKGPAGSSPDAPSRTEAADQDDKRPRTAFSAEQLARLKKEFDENRYLTEQRRQQLARDLGLNESQIKIWFQNKRAKVKKASGQKNRLAMELMAQGLYNHATVTADSDEHK